MKSRNSCYYSVKNHLFSSTLSKNIKVYIYRTTILSFVLHGRENWSPTVSEKHWLRCVGNRVLRKVFGPMMDLVMLVW